MGIYYDPDTFDHDQFVEAHFRDTCSEIDPVMLHSLQAYDNIKFFGLFVVKCYDWYQRTNILSTRLDVALTTDASK